MNHTEKIQKVIDQLNNMQVRGIENMNIILNCVNELIALNAALNDEKKAEEKPENVVEIENE